MEVVLLLNLVSRIFPILPAEAGAGAEVWLRHGRRTEMRLRHHGLREARLTVASIGATRIPRRAALIGGRWRRVRGGRVCRRGHRRHHGRRRSEVGGRGGRVGLRGSVLMMRTPVDAAPYRGNDKDEPPPGKHAAKCRTAGRPGLFSGRGRRGHWPARILRRRVPTRRTRSARIRIHTAIGLSGRRVGIGRHPDAGLWRIAIVGQGRRVSGRRSALWHGRRIRGRRSVLRHRGGVTGHGGCAIMRALSRGNRLRSGSRQGNRARYGSPRSGRHRRAKGGKRRQTGRTGFARGLIHLTATSGTLRH